MIDSRQSKKYSYRHRGHAKELFVWGVLWALTYLLFGNAASVSATVARATVAPKPAALPQNGVAPAPAATTLVATKNDALVVDNARSGVADPGDTLEYTVIITSTGSSDATRRPSQIPSAARLRRRTSVPAGSDQPAVKIA